MDKVTKRRRVKEGVEWGKGPLATEGVLCLDISARVPEFLVTPLLMGRSAYVARAGLKSQSVTAFNKLCTFHSLYAQSSLNSITVSVSHFFEKIETKDDTGVNKCYIQLPL